MRVVYYLHLLGATVWIGGLITLGVTMSAARGANADRIVIATIARRFGVLSATAMGLLVLTGLIQASSYGWSGTLLIKVSLVLASILLTVWHALGARTQPDATRGLIQATILVLALVILGLAVAL